MGRYEKERKQKNASGDWCCKYCPFVGRTRRELQKHHKDEHGFSKSHPSWNKGLTKDNDPRVKQASETFSKRYSGENALRLGSKHTEATKKKLSEIRKKQIKENGGIWWSSRSKCKRSYAEEWTKRLLETELSNFPFVEEYHFGKWFMDFAWPELKIYLEIDGSQHEWPSRKAMDVEKDTYCKENGWKCLRLTWKYIMRNTSEAISSIKSFVTSASSIG